MNDVNYRDSSDVDLLAAVIGTGSHRSGYAAAALLLDRFGSLRCVLQANNSELLACRGVGRARLAIIESLPELARRYYDQSLPTGTAIRSPADTEAFLKARIRHLDHELFCCLYLDLCVAGVYVE